MKRLLVVLSIGVFFQSAWMQYWHFTGNHDEYTQSGVC